MRTTKTVGSLAGMSPSLVLSLLACHPSGDIVIPGDPAPLVEIVAPGAFDPVLGGAAAIDVVASATGTGTLQLDIVAADGTVIRHHEQAVSGDETVGWDWDGLDASGAPAGVGAYRIDAQLLVGQGVETVSQPIAVVRAQFEAALAEGDGVTAVQVPLYWHSTGDLQDLDVPFASLPSIDEGLDLPGASGDLERMPDQQPVAFVWDSRPIVTLVPGESTIWGGSGVDAAAIEVEVAGWTTLSGSPLVAGVPVVLQRDAAIANGPGVVEETLAIELVAGEWTIGVQHVPMRIYALFDEPDFDEAGERYHPWVAVVDPALRAIEGVAPDHDRVVDALVDWIYYEQGLKYDTRYGASAYVNYRYSSWDQANFYLADFLARRYGSTVNCTDCAAILGAYANMVGARLNYTIILRDFPLNFIRAIGYDEHTRCPFGSTGCGFSYHAVTTDDGGGTIWDATLALDGDADPATAPNTVLGVKSIPGDEYLDRLSDGNPDYQYESQGTIQ